MESKKIHSLNIDQDRYKNLLILLVPSIIFAVVLAFLVTFIWEERMVASYTTVEQDASSN